MPLALKAREGAPPYAWFVDGAPVGAASFGGAMSWQPSGPGFVHLMVIDANGLHDVGLQVSGQASGVLLERVTVRNARKQAVNLSNVAAEPSSPLTLTNCRFVLPAGAEAGVNLAGSSAVDCRGVRILDNRFEGLGAGSGVRVEGAGPRSWWAGAG